MSRIQLGFITKATNNPNLNDSDKDNDNDSHLPVNKIGGKPVFLDFKNKLSSSKVTCQVCGGVLALLLQLYCPEDYPENAFHRMLYVFMCKNGSCLAGRSQSALRVFRSQLPLQNEIYDQDGKLQDEVALTGKNSNSCSVCGLYAPSRCGKCQNRQYCSKDHQALDWTQGKHKDYCSSSKTELDNSNTNTRSLHPNPVFNRWIDACALFPCHELEEDEEPEKTNKSTDDEFLKQRLANTLVDLEEDELLEEEQETDTDVDKTFLKFQKRISLAPDQVLRYGRVLPYDNEEPLWACGEGIPTTADVPACGHCGAERTFEFQITPQLLVHLELDHKDESAIDYGTVVFYTCSKHCDAANDGKYSEEWFFKQDFSSAGLGDGIRNRDAQKTDSPEISTTQEKEI